MHNKLSSSQFYQILLVINQTIYMPYCYTVAVGCVAKRFLRRCNIHIYSTQTEIPLQTKVQIPPKSNLVSQRVLWRLLIGIWVKSYLPNRNNSYITKPTQRGDSSQIWEPRNHTACRQLNRSKRVPFKCFGCSEPLPRNLAYLCFFQAVGLVLESFCSLPCLRETLSSYRLHILAGRHFVNLLIFRDFLKLFWVVCFVLGSLPAG